MGNGESTAKRISMQKTDEGSVQISQEVMNRLKKRQVQDDPSTRDSEQENGIRIKEESLKLLMKDAFEKGRNVGEKKILEQMQAKAEEQEYQRQKESEEFRNFTRSEIEDLRKQVEEAEKQANLELEGKNKLLQGANIELEGKEKSLHALNLELEEKGKSLLARNLELEEKEKLLQTASAELEDKEKLLQAAKEQILIEKDEKEEIMKKHESKGENLKIEFERGVADIQKMIRPLQIKTISCVDLQKDVIDCYTEHRSQPLRCAKIVDEYRKCVSEAKLKQMDANGS